MDKPASIFERKIDLLGEGGQKCVEIAKTPYFEQLSILQRKESETAIGFKPFLTVPSYFFHPICTGLTLVLMYNSNAFCGYPIAILNRERTPADRASQSVSGNKSTRSNLQYSVSPPHIKVRKKEIGYWRQR